MNNSFAAAHPELVCEWSEKNLPLMPDKITYGSNKIVWWKANCGHEWQTSVKAVLPERNAQSVRAQELWRESMIWQP